MHNYHNLREFILSTSVSWKLIKEVRNNIHSFIHSGETINRLEDAVNPSEQAIKNSEEPIKYSEEPVNQSEVAINQSEELIKYNLLLFSTLQLSGVRWKLYLVVNFNDKF